MTIPSLPTAGANWTAWATGLDTEARTIAAKIGTGQVDAAAAAAVNDKNSDTWAAIGEMFGVGRVGVAPPSGGDDTAALQAVINAAAGKAVVTFDGDAEYEVHSLHLPSGTFLDLGQATLRQVDAVLGSFEGAVLRNSDDVGGNTGITVVGGTIAGGTGSDGRLISFTNVDKIRLQGVNVEKGSGTFVDYMTTFVECNDVIVQGCRITGGTAVGEDGIHIEACTRVAIDNCVIESGDDCIGIVQENTASGPSTDITITNIVASTRKAGIIRVTVLAGETHGIERVHISNVVGVASLDSSGLPIQVNNLAAAGLIRDVTLDGVSIDCNTAPGHGLTVIGAESCTFRSVRLDGLTGRYLDAQDSVDLVFEDCHGTTRSGALAVDAFYLDGITRASLRGCTSTESGQHAFVVTGGSEDVEFTACKSLDPIGISYFLITGDGITLLGCTANGGSHSVQCDTGTPPTHVRVIGCTLTGMIGNSLETAPGDIIYLANIDDGKQFGNNPWDFIRGTDAVAGDQTMDRTVATAATSLGSSGTMKLSYFTATKTEAVTTVRLATGTPAAATPTIARVGLYTVATDGSLVLVASSTNNTTALSTSGLLALPLSASYTKRRGQRYALGILVVSAATIPTVYGTATSPGTIADLAPKLNGQVTGQTDLPSSVASGSIGVANNTPWAQIAPA